MKATIAQKKKNVALFQGNFELMAITENLVFTDPYFLATNSYNFEVFSSK